MKFTLVLLATAAACAPTKRETNAGGLLGPLGSVVPSSGMGDAAQDATAEAFKLGDAILNTPGDAIGKAMSGDVVGAASGAVKDATTLAGQLPSDAGKIMGDMMGN